MTMLTLPVFLSLPPPVSYPRARTEQGKEDKCLEGRSRATWERDSTAVPHMRTEAVHTSRYILVWDQSALKHRGG